MNVVETHFLTTDPRTIAAVKAVLADVAGKVYVTTRLGLDMMDSEDSVESFTAGTDGSFSHVKEYGCSEWDFVLVGMMMGGAVAVVESQNVYDAHSRLLALVNAGISIQQAVQSLMPE
ncbi:hypothetical protein ACI77O_12115 [Pseudomonas tritici]|uniref:hypothetical protein n=1 Tax=Pseudomonas tritici TaxID=2745518 RepID=UPI00387B1E9A